MALTYTESSALMNDLDFRGRIKVAALTYAQYIAGEAPSTVAHNSRYNWAQRTFQQPDTTAAGLQSTVVMEPQVQADGAAITDQNLQSAVESSVNKII